MRNQPQRTAIVRGRDISPERIAPYLPNNYRVTESNSDTVTISGHDHAGWALDDYVIPRLASGLWFATEVTS